jgi:6-phosphogluconolactonase
VTTPLQEVLVRADAVSLARTVAEQLVARLAAAQASHGRASVVLTGGGIGTAVLEQVAALATGTEGAGIDWTAVDVWWGDERFVPADSDDRNEKAARRALLDAVAVPDARVHPMPPADGGFPSPEDAAAWYADQLAAAAGPGSGAAGPGSGAAGPGSALPRFDVLLLGIGAEGHTASIFPASPAAHDERPVVAVRNCPKPPPTRVSLGFRAINTAEEVWLVVAGAEKAPAVARALAGADPVELPAAGVHGRRSTRWLLDAAAASDLPEPPG